MSWFNADMNTRLSSLVRAQWSIHVAPAAVNVILGNKAGGESASH